MTEQQCDEEMTGIGLVGPLTTSAEARSRWGYPGLNPWGALSPSGVTAHDIQGRPTGF